MTPNAYLTLAILVALFWLGLGLWLGMAFVVGTVFGGACIFALTCWALGEIAP